MPTIAELISSYRDRMGTPSYEVMSRKVRNEIAANRLHQIHTRPLKSFAEARTIELLAELLEVPVTTIVLAFAAGLGLPVSTQESRVSLLMPPETDKLLSDRDIAALVDMARSMVNARVQLRTITSYESPDGKRIGFAQPTGDTDPGPIAGPEPTTVEDYGLAARRGPSEGRRLRDQQDVDAES